MNVDKGIVELHLDPTQISARNYLSASADSNDAESGEFTRFITRDRPYCPETVRGSALRRRRRAVSGVCRGVRGRGSGECSVISESRSLVPVCGIMESVGLGEELVPLIFVMETSRARLRRRRGARCAPRGLVAGLEWVRLGRWERVVRAFGSKRWWTLTVMVGGAGLGWDADSGRWGAACCWWDGVSSPRWVLPRFWRVVCRRLFCRERPLFCRARLLVCSCC